MKKTRTLIIVTILVAVLGLLTVSMAIAGQGPEASLASVTGASANPTGESQGAPDLGGTLLVDQQPDQSNGIFADEDCDSCAATGMQSMAENFVLTDTYDINRVVIWSGYFPGNTSPPDDLDVLFHNDAGGTIGSNISSESNVPSSRSQTGVVLFGVNEWMTVMTLTTPVQLGPGTYWVEVFNNTAGNTDSYFWEAGTQDPVAGAPGILFSTSTPGVTWNPATGAPGLAFQLWGSQGVQPMPAIALTKTVGVTPGVCATTNSINVPAAGADVYYCYEVMNTGNITLSLHDLVDDQLGTLLTGFAFDLGPGASVDSVAAGLEVSATITQTTVNSATWTAYNNSQETASANSSATVNVNTTPTSVSLSGFGSDSAASPVWLVALLAVVVGFGFALRRKITA